MNFPIGKQRVILFIYDFLFLRLYWSLTWNLGLELELDNSTQKTTWIWKDSGHNKDKLYIPQTLHFIHQHILKVYTICYYWIDADLRPGHWMQYRLLCIYVTQYDISGVEHTDQSFLTQIFLNITILYRSQILYSLRKEQTVCTLKNKKNFKH